MALSILHILRTILFALILSFVRGAGISAHASASLLDTGFADRAINGHVFAIVAQSDGKILVGGYFTSVAGVGRTYLARLNSDGTPDTAFNPVSMTWLKYRFENIYDNQENIY